jgi:hypothetical protein
MEVVFFSEMSVSIYRGTRRNIPEDTFIVTFFNLHHQVNSVNLRVAQ